MENWIDVKNFEGLYQVSNLGNVRGVDRYIKHYKGGVRLQKGIDKKLRLGTDGYFKVGL